MGDSELDHILSQPRGLPHLSPSLSDISCTTPSTPTVMVSSPSQSTCKSISVESDDSSIASSASSYAFNIPDKWRPSIMECIDAPTAPESRRLLTPSVRNEIVHDIVTQMYMVWSQPTSNNCAELHVSWLLSILLCEMKAKK